ncbi:MAG: tRNA pseudouridine(13) synthase TruD [Planctomycetota bacterium]
MPSAYLTDSLPGTGGALRERLEDFVVAEELVRPPRGRGAHRWILVEKRGISTPEFLRRIGAALGLPTARLGAAGQKDARAVARQWVSAPGSAAIETLAARLSDATVLEIARDEEPLAPRLLARNRFAIVVRGLADPAEAARRAQAVLDVLAARGVPSFYGPQRFGLRGESAEVGRLLLLGRAEEALALILGRPGPGEDDPRARAFREAFERGELAEALRLVPGALRVERRLLERLAAGATAATAIAALPRPQARFYLTAYQSLLFNRVLAARLPAIDVPWAGDLLAEEGKGERWTACRDPEADRARVRAFAASPTGPLAGTRAPLAAGEAGRIEREVLAASGADPRALPDPPGLPLHGTRKSLRFRAADLRVRADPANGALELGFALPPGCFATALLAEVTKGFAPPR